MSLNGGDFAILEAGDGRSNKITCMKKFHNELMVWQEEKGEAGGCLTLFEGYSPETFGKLLLSSKVGTFNAKSVAVVDGVLTSTRTDESIKTLAYFLSHYGVCVTDGRTVTVISDDIQNYFDPAETECIRRGYENDMWLAHDSSCNVLRMGLVSGSSATTCNIFPVYDLSDGTWSFDVIAQELSCLTEVEAASGALAVLQYGGGVDDGTVYQLNYGTNDITTAIDAYVTLEFSGQGEFIDLREIILRCKTQTAGNMSLTITQNAIAAITAKSLSMIAETTNQIVRRHRISMNVMDQHISIKIQHNTESQDMYLEDMGVKLLAWKER